MSRDLHFTNDTLLMKASRRIVGSENLLRLSRQSLYNSAEFAKSEPEQVPDWLQSDKIRKAQEKRARKAARRDSGSGE